MYEYKIYRRPVCKLLKSQSNKHKKYEINNYSRGKVCSTIKPIKREQLKKGRHSTGKSKIRTVCEENMGKAKCCMANTLEADWWRRHVHMAVEGRSERRD